MSVAKKGAEGREDGFRYNASQVFMNSPAGVIVVVCNVNVDS